MHVNRVNKHLVNVIIIIDIKYTSIVTVWYAYVCASVYTTFVH